MKTLNAPDNNHIAILEQVIEKKSEPRKSILRPIKGKIIAQYSIFENLINNSDLIFITSIVLSDDQKESLIHCYNSKTIEVTKMLIGIKKIQDNIFQIFCPYCGLFHSTTIDHYLPKEDFPEFSILALNLIPCCSKCNSRKNITWKEGNERKFIYFYADKIPQEQYLYCNLTYSNMIPLANFSLHFPTSIDVSIVNLIKSHYSKLKLLEEYKDHANVFLSEHINSIKIYFNGTKSKLIDSLKQQHYSYKQSHGVNHWKTAIFESIINNDDLVNDILDKNI